MQSTRKGSDILNLSQSLQDNSTKIEETQQLIQQIERQLQQLSKQPIIPLSIPTEAVNQQPNELYQESLQKQLPQNYDSSNYSTNQQIFNQQDNQTVDNNENNSNEFNHQIELINHEKKQSLCFEDRSQNSQFQKHSPNNSQPITPTLQNRELNQIKDQTIPPSIEERSLNNDIGNTPENGVSGTFNNDEAKVNVVNGTSNQSQMNSKREREGIDIKELQREHFQEVSMLEQAYRKKILQMEELIEAQKQEYDQQVLKMQQMLSIIEQKENMLGQYNDNQQKSTNGYRFQGQQMDLYQQLVLYARRLEICENEKQELIKKNEELTCQNKLIVGQNDILSNKYNRILSLYNQLVEVDKEKLTQTQYVKTTEKENPLFQQSLQQQPNFHTQDYISTNQFNNSTLNNNRSGQQNLYDSHYQQQNLDLLDEFYKYKFANDYNQLFYKPTTSHNTSRQFNTFTQIPQNIPLEQMFNNQQNTTQLQRMQNIYLNPYVQQVDRFHVGQNKEQHQQSIQQQQKIQRDTLQYRQNLYQNQQNNFTTNENNMIIPSKDNDNQKQYNSSIKNEQISLYDESQLKSKKKYEQQARQMNKQISDLKRNVNEIKDTLAENLKMYDYESENRLNTKSSKGGETLQNILDFTGSNKKQKQKNVSISPKSFQMNNSSLANGNKFITSPVNKSMQISKTDRSAQFKKQNK